MSLGRCFYQAHPSPGQGHTCPVRATKGTDLVCLSVSGPQNSVQSTGPLSYGHTRQTCSPGFLASPIPGESAQGWGAGLLLSLPLPFQPECLAPALPNGTIRDAPYRGRGRAGGALQCAPTPRNPGGLAEGVAGRRKLPRLGRGWMAVQERRGLLIRSFSSKVSHPPGTDDVRLLPRGPLPTSPPPPPKTVGPQQQQAMGVDGVMASHSGPLETRAGQPHPVQGCSLYPICTRTRSGAAGHSSFAPD